MNGFEVRFKNKKVTIGMCNQVVISGLFHDKLFLDTLDNGMKSSSDCSMCENLHGWFDKVMTCN